MRHISLRCQPPVYISFRYTLRNIMNIIHLMQYLLFLLTLNSFVLNTRWRRAARPSFIYFWSVSSHCQINWTSADGQHLLYRTKGSSHAIIKDNRQHTISINNHSSFVFCFSFLLIVKYHWIEQTAERSGQRPTQSGRKKIREWRWMREKERIASSF